jgi:hypothetical protein
MANPRPGDWTPSPHRLTAVPVSGPDRSGQPPYYLNGYEHEDPLASVAVEPEPLPPGWATPGWSAPGWSDPGQSEPGWSTPGWSGPAAARVQTAAPVPPMPAPPMPPMPMPPMPSRPAAPARPAGPTKAGTGDPWDHVQSNYSPAEIDPRHGRDQRDLAATGTRALWMIALAFAILMTIILTVR